MSPDLEKQKPIQFHYHTLETLCTELVSGRAILVDDKGHEFRLVSPRTRALFNWYRVNQDTWAGRNTKKDVDALADLLDETPPELPSPAIASSDKPKRLLHLKRVRVHRFAGIHRYGTPEKPPEEFGYELTKPLTLIEGRNGSGKTSLLSAIAWCLTGHVYRSQREPEFVSEPVSISVAAHPDVTAATGDVHDMAAITPMPPQEVLASLGPDRLLLDTWVELTFVDDEGKEVAPLKRSVHRSPRGRVRVAEPDFSGLGVDPVAREVGTKMPGLIPYIELGKRSSLGEAVAALIGISPLLDLVKHVGKSIDKLEDDLPKDRVSEIKKIDADFRAAQDELEALIKEHLEVAPQEAIPEPAKTTTAKVEVALGKYKAHLEALQSEAFAKSKAILGDTFDPSDESSRQDLTKAVGPAIGQLDAKNIRALPAANRLAVLGHLPAQGIAKAQDLVDEIVSQGAELARLSDQPSVHARLRLYARVAAWMKELPESADRVDLCPVCQNALEGNIDPVTGKPVAAHIGEFLKADAAHLEKTLGDWEQWARGRLLVELPPGLSGEVRDDLPDRPADLIVEALTNKLFEFPHFKGELAALKTPLRALCDRVLGGLAPYEEPAPPVIPDCFSESEASLRRALQRLVRALAFARWRKANADSCREAFLRIVGSVEAGRRSLRPPEEPVENWPLSDRLLALERMIQDASPLAQALAKVATLARKLTERKAKNKRIELYRHTAEALEPLLELGKLVEQQVGSLMRELSSATAHWRNLFYTSSFINAPEVVATDVWRDGSLAFQAECLGTRVPAEHVSNASDLRATLLAFVVALWGYLLKTRGGLSLLLLDDLPVLFDPENFDRVAASLRHLVDAGARAVVTTSNHRFGEEAQRAVGPGDAERLMIHPLGAPRAHIELGLFEERITEKQKEFLENENDDKAAQEYVEELRIYIEQRIEDFFSHTPEPGLPPKPTVSDLLNAVRRFSKHGIELFSKPAFANLVSYPHLAANSEFVNVMNASHHGHQGLITYKRVYSLKDVCARVTELVSVCYMEYGNWLSRGPSEVEEATPVSPEAMPPPLLDVPLIDDLAAFTSGSWPSEIVETGERFCADALNDHALYVVSAHNLGFAAPRNCRAIVRLSQEMVPDSSLVIALHGEKTYARRLLRDRANPAVITLGSEAEDPSKRSPSLIPPAAEVRLLQIVGILFEDRPHYPRPREEATLAGEWGVLGEVEAVFRVRGNSALPLALEGQKVLGGRCLTPADIAGLEGSLVAIATSDGAALKRIGAAVPGAGHIRQFESIGGRGESMLVRTEDIEDGFGALPVLHSARLVLGVLYEPV